MAFVLRFRGHLRQINRWKTNLKGSGSEMDKGESVALSKGGRAAQIGYADCKEQTKGNLVTS